MGIETLKRRSEYQRVRGGGRFSSPAFVLEGKPRVVAGGEISGPRFGFTVTKKLGGAVVRNRIRRRLKAAVAGLAPLHADAGYDYVVVAREPARVLPFDAMCAELSKAFRRVNGAGAESLRRKPVDEGKRSRKV